MLTSRRRFLAALAAGAAGIPTKGDLMVDRLIYSETRTAVADAGGNATVVFSGPPSQTRRRLDSIAVVVSSDTPRPTCRVYRGTIAAGAQMAETALGNADTFRGDHDWLNDGEPFYVVWSGAAPGSTCTANAQGVDERA